MDTPNTRSRAKRDLEGALSTPGASQDEPRVLWDHDRRFKREFVDNMKDVSLPIPAPTQQPSIPRYPTNPAASNRPRKRPCNRNRSVPSGSIHAASPILPAAGPSSAPTPSTNLDILLKDYFALHGGASSSSTSHHHVPSPPRESDTLASPYSARTSSRLGEITPAQPTAQASLDHPLPQMSALALDTVNTPSKRKSIPPKALHISRTSARTPRETPPRNVPKLDGAKGRPAAPSPLQAIPLQASQSRRLGPSLSQGETAKSLGPPPRIGLRTSHDPNKPSISHNPAKAFKSPLPSQGLRSSPRRHAPPQTTTSLPQAKSAPGPVRALHPDASTPRPSPLRTSRNAPNVANVNAPRQIRAPAPTAKIPLPKMDHKMPSSDGAGTGDDSFGSFEVDDMDAFLREVDGLSGQ